MPGNIYRYLKWSSAPKDINSLTAICLFMVSLVPIWFMFVYYHSVIIENHAFNDDPMFRMVAEADAFVEHLHTNVSGNDLLNDYQWLKNFEMLVRSDCHIVPGSLKHLHYTGYVMAAYNIFLMHVLLNDLLPVLVVASVPIIISLISSDIDPSNTILLGLFEFSQALLAIMIMIMFFFLNERRRTISEPIFVKDHKP
ncbi:unnamed protein product [Rotaria socialis]|uniref:Uncharacterized protein n=1 Tax=Rotaria socialis TaxID=392032 RepID=A0A820T7Y1_9BILA|nr:unnamed protein product [Rotaria socialis]CAF4466730.1 unnamed protein product [Rotaria socialis]